MLDQVRQRATAAEEALEAAEERSEKYRAMIDEANVELNDFKGTYVYSFFLPILSHKAS